MLKKVLFLLSFVLIVLAIFFLYQKSRAQQHTSDTAPIQNKQHINTSQQTTATNSDQDIPATQHLAHKNLKNAAYIQSMYEKKNSDRVISMLKEEQYNLEQYGHLHPFQDPQKDFLNLEDTEHLSQYASNLSTAKEKLGYVPLAQDLSPTFKIDHNFIVAGNVNPQIITVLSSGDKILFISQKKSDQHEKMLKEYINRYIGENKDIGAIYQQYNDKQIQGLTVVNQNYSYVVKTINLSEQEFNDIVKMLQ